jgi:hypothetical protein
VEPSASGKLRGGVQVTGPPLVAGPHAPARSTPPRSPGSVRRTTSIDTVRPDGPHGALVVDARGRDLRTGHDDAAQAEVLGEVALTLRLEPATHTLVDVRADGSDGHAADAPDLRPLVGARVGSGFRRLLDEAMPEERHRGSAGLRPPEGIIPARSAQPHGGPPPPRCSTAWPKTPRPSSADQSRDREPP